MLNNKKIVKNWRDEFKYLGRSNFQIKEMLRLGFIPQDYLDEIKFDEIKQKEIQDLSEELVKHGLELEQVLNELDNKPNIQELLNEIRKQRITESKEKRAVKRQIKIEKSEESKKQQEIARSENPSFLGEGVSRRMSYSNFHEERLKENNQPLFRSFEDLSTFLKVKKKHLTGLAYYRPTAKSDNYFRFEIPKRDGTKRILSSPKTQLKGVQQIILRELLQQVKLSNAATAFVAGSGIVDNALRHNNSNVVVKMDIENFFPNISFFRVQNLFELLGHSSAISTILALLTTDSQRARFELDGDVYFAALGLPALPQGAPTSPALANLVSRHLDLRILKFCEQSADLWVYTRYADDLIFSSNQEKSDIGRLLRMIEKIIKDEGFRVNHEKTKVMRKPNRQIVTGIVLGEELRLPKIYLKKLRAFNHRCKTLGFDQVSKEIGQDARSVLKGHLSFVNMVMPDYVKKFK